jgi:hypothetical protein
VGRERTRRFVERTVAAAGVDLSAAAAWVLVRGVGGAPLDDPAALAEGHPIPVERVREALAELRDRGLVDGAGLTAAGAGCADRLAAARRANLERLVADWQPDGDERLDAAIARLARELAEPAPV